MRISPLLLLLASCAPSDVSGLAAGEVLQWEAFPPAGLADLKGRSVTDVVYDLKVFRDNFLLYERAGLVEPRHRLEVALEPGWTWSYSVRVRFRVDGRPRQTQWGALSRLPASPK